MAINSSLSKTLPFFLFLFFFLTILLEAHSILGHDGAQDTVPYHLPDSDLLASKEELQSQGSNREGFWRMGGRGPRRYLIGSTAPTCTYECRGCRFKCTAEQVPVDANNPINSAYRYRCVCHR